MTSGTLAPSVAIMPNVSNLGSGTHRLSFTAYAATASKTLEVGYMTDPLDMSTFEVLEVFDMPGTTASTAQRFFYTPTGVPSGVMALAFRNPGNPSGYTVYVDNVAWEPIPSCQDVSSLTYSDLTFFTATISWEPNGSETAWQYALGISTDTDPDALFSVNVTDTTVTIEDLSSDIGNYKVWVRANCGNGNYGPWTFPVSFKIGYCFPVSTNTGDYISNFTTTGAIQNINHSLTSIPGGNGYADYTDMIIEQEAGETVSFSTTYVGGSNRILIWVDWNNSGGFSANEQMFNQTFSSATNSGSFVIPEDIPAGDYRLRLRSRFYITDIDACEDIGYGDARDYILRVSSPMSVENPVLHTLKVYPNPVKDILNISFSQNITNVEVYNLLGQKVVTKAVNTNQGQVDMSHLAAGTYLVKVTADNQTKTIKVIKQ